MIHTEINKSSKSSKASLRKIHKALEGIYSSETNNISDEEKEDKSPMSANVEKRIHSPKPKIRLTKSKFDNANISNEFINSLEEVKMHVKGSDGDTPKQLDTLEDESEDEPEGLEDYELWTVSKWKKILRNNPKSEKAYFRLGVLSMKENLIKARACFKECQEIDPEFRKANILELIGDCVYKNEKEDYSKAIQFYEDALKIETTNMALAIKIGRWYEKLNENNTAITYYQKAVEFDQNHNSAPIFRLAWAYIRNNNLEKGVEKLKEALAVDPNNAEILNKLGETLLRMNNEEMLDQAKVALHKSVKIDSTSYEAYLNLGRVYRKKNNTDLSIKWFEKALRRTKTPADVYFYLADAFEK